MANPSVTNPNPAVAPTVATVSTVPLLAPSPKSRGGGFVVDSRARCAATGAISVAWCLTTSARSSGGSGTANS